MSDERAAQLFDEAATAGLHITGLDGWTQTRLAGSLKLRREVVNAIINRDPVAEPSDSRPRMVEACRRIIAFAAVISRKDDAVLPREVDPSHSLDDDAQAYETHKLRLRRLVEDAVAGGAFIEGMFRVGELSSQAVHAPPRFRVQMIGNVVTAIQRLLDKPQSRSIPADLVAHNLRRLTLAEWAARRVVREMPAGEGRTKAADDLAYIRGQVGYAMIFSGLLAHADKALRRGRRRLWRAVRVQPSPDCGHWSNLLRAINDLLANGHRPAQEWACAVVGVAEKQHHPGFALAFSRLRGNGELATLVNFWESGGVMSRVTGVLGRGSGATPSKASPARRRNRKGATAAAILLLVGLLAAPPAARAGDGKELATQRGPAQRVAAPVVSRANAGVDSNGDGGDRGAITSQTTRGASSYGPRYGQVSTQRSGLYPGRQSRFSRDTERPAPALAVAPTESAEDAFVPQPRFTRAGGLPPLVAARNGRAVRLYDDDVDAGPTTTTRRGRDVEGPDEEVAPIPTPRRAARSAAPAKSANRLFPLIVARDVAPRTRTRTIPRQSPPKDSRSTDDASTEAPSTAATPKSPPVAVANEPESRPESRRRS